MKTRGLAVINAGHLLSDVKKHIDEVTPDDVNNSQGDINATDKMGWPVMYHAAYNGRSDLCEAALEKGALTKVKDVAVNALSLAITREHEETCLVIINNWPSDDSFPLTVKLKNQTTFLHQAAAYGLPTVCQLLKELLGVEGLLMEDVKHRTPLQYAREHCKSRTKLAELETILRPSRARGAGRAAAAGNARSSRGRANHASGEGGSSAGSNVASTRKRRVGPGGAEESRAKKRKETAEGGQGSGGNRANMTQEQGESSCDKPDCAVLTTVPSSTTARRSKGKQTDGLPGDGQEGMQPNASRSEGAGSGASKVTAANQCARSAGGASSVEADNSKAGDMEPGLARETAARMESSVLANEGGGLSGSGGRILGENPMSADAAARADKEAIVVKDKQVVDKESSSASEGGSLSGVSVGQDSVPVNSASSTNTETVAAIKNKQVVEKESNAGSEGGSSSSGQNVERSDLASLKLTLAQKKRASCASNLEKCKAGLLEAEAEVARLEGAHKTYAEAAASCERKVKNAKTLLRESTEEATPALKATHNLKLIGGQQRSNRK